MSGYMSEESFEEWCQDIAKKHDKPIEDVRIAARITLQEHGIQIGLPMEERIRRAQIRAAEMVVIEGLYEKGLLGPDKETLLFDGGENDTVHA